MESERSKISRVSSSELGEEKGGWDHDDGMRLSMIPARNLLRRHCDTYGGALLFGGGGNDDNEENTHFDVFNKFSRLSSLNTISDMADEPPSHDRGGNEEDEEAGTSGSSKNWLQLGLTTSTMQPTPSMLAPADRREPLMELELFTDRPRLQMPMRSQSSAAAVMASPMADTSFVAQPEVVGTSFPSLAGLPSMSVTPMQPAVTYGLSYYRPEMSLPLGVYSPNLLIGSSSSVLSPPPMPELMARQYMYPPGSFGSTLATAAAAAAEGVGGMVVISPPRRPQTGIWFLLRASQNQGREPFLPQIFKSYLRIKDGRMTVRLLMKYLVNKLGLEDESQVEMTCRGQVLHPLLTLQHVRDNIWCLREPVTLSADSPTTDHIMTLQYSRRA